MSYCTLDRAKLIAGDATCLRLFGVKDEIGVATGAVSDELLQVFLDVATNEIDGFLAGIEGITIPLSPVPPQIEVYCLDIALYRGSPVDSVELEALKRRYDNAMKYLNDVAKGKILLVAKVATQADVQETSQVQVPETMGFDETDIIAGQDRLFTRNKMWSL